MNVNKPGSDGRPRRANLLFCALQADFAGFSVVCYVCLVYPQPHFGLLSCGEAVRDELAQNISMRAPETTAVIPNGSHYRDSQYRLILHAQPRIPQLPPLCWEAEEVGRVDLCSLRSLTRVPSIGPYVPHPVSAKAWLPCNGEPLQ